MQMSQQMLYFPQQAFPMQEHLQPHPAATMGQQLTPGVSQMVYPSQQMQVIVVRACVSVFNGSAFCGWRYSISNRNVSWQRNGARNGLDVDVSVLLAPVVFSCTQCTFESKARVE